MSFKPDWRSPPLDTILDVLVVRKLSVIEAEHRLGFKLDGDLVIDAERARRLEKVIGSNAAFWLKREEHYREPLSPSR